MRRFEESGRQWTAPAVAGVTLALQVMGTPADAAGQPDPPSTAPRVVESSGQSYEVPVGGTLGPENVTVRVQNTGTTTIERGRLVVNGRDWSSIDAILASVLSPGMTDEAKARALWQFVRENQYHWPSPSYQTREGTDPVELVGVYGYGLCTQVNAALGALFERAGLPARFWLLAGQHDVVEVFFSDDWHLMDADRDGLYLEWDNTTIASVEDLRSDPALVARAGAGHAELVELYGAAGPTWWRPASAVYRVGRDLGWRLAPGEWLEFDWTAGGYHDDAGWGAPPPPTRASGRRGWGWHAGMPDALARFAQAGHTALAVLPSGMPGLTAATPSAPAVVTMPQYVSYPVVGASLTLRGFLGSPDDRVEVLASPHVGRIELLGSDVLAGGHRLAGVFAGESGVATYSEDGNWPALHAMRGLVPGAVVYRVRPSPGALAIGVGGRFYRFDLGDLVAVSVSVDGTAWTPAWTAAPNQLGYIDAVADVTGVVSGAAAFFVRYELLSRSLGPLSVGWTAGLQAIRMEGVGGVEPVVVGTIRAGEPGAFDTVVDLGPAVAAPGDSAHYQYSVTIRVTSQGGVSGVESFDLESEFQVAPGALPGLAKGVNEVRLLSDTADFEATVTHTWREVHRAHAPSPPARPIHPADGGSIAQGAAIPLNWEPALDDDGEAMFQYEVLVCGSPACEVPLAGIFEHRTAPYLSPGADAILGTPDDVKTPDDAHEWIAPFGSWLIEGRTYYWKVRAQDIEGHWGPFGPVWSFSVDSHAKAPPSVTIAQRVGEQPIPSTSPFVALNGSAGSEAGAVSVAWRTDSGATGGATGALAWTIDAVPLHRGLNTITVVASDAAGREWARTLRVQVQRLEYLLSEGATGDFFDLDLDISNPTDDDAPVQVEFLTPGGAPVERSLTLAPMTHQRIRVDDVAGLESTSVSAVVSSLHAVPLVVTRRMTWSQGERYAGHAGGAVDGPRRRWYFAEGSEGFFDTFVLLANANAFDVTATATFLFEGGESLVRHYTVAALSRMNLDARFEPELRGRSFGILVDADAPIVAERSMYFGTGRQWRGGHESPGATTLATTWYFAEGATGATFDTYLLVSNPSNKATDVTVRYLVEGGAPVVRKYALAPWSRLTVDVEGESPALAAASFGMIVTATAPIVAERSMYWPGRWASWAEAHNVIGSARPYTAWGLSGGEVGGPLDHRTYVLLANPQDTAADVAVTVVAADARRWTRTYRVAAGARLTVPVSQAFPELGPGVFSAVVEAAGNVAVVVEQAVYWNALGATFGAGTCAAGTPLPR